MEHIAQPIDRPPPGHYQGRLGAVLDRLPAGATQTPAQWQPAAAPRRVLVRARCRRTGQLALPLERVRG
ncbi:MAG TPA: hypothetical protein VLO10_07395 [Candidatus Deferrimicrobium sp.]|nr:hypothetical protein [Candidatus Deferrimicrobium sp.]